MPAPAGGLAGSRPAHHRRPAAARGLAVLLRLPRLYGSRARPRARPLRAAPAPAARETGARRSGGSGRRRARRLGRVRLDHDGRPVLRLHVHPRDREHADRAERPRQPRAAAPGDDSRVPGLVGAAAGLVLSFALLRSRATIGIAAAVLAGAGFALLAIFGLPIAVRYAMPLAALLCIFCAVGLLGWRLLPSRHRWRRRWQLVAVGVALIFVVQAPPQYDRLLSTRRVLEAQSGAESDLRKIAQSGAIEDRCRPVAVAINRAVPRLGEWLDMAPADIAVATLRRQPRRGYYFVPGSGVVGTRRAPRRRPGSVASRASGRGRSTRGARAGPRRCPRRAGDSNVVGG